jgi:hypothetical protein
MVYLGACLIAGICLAREKHLNTRVVHTIHAIDESRRPGFRYFHTRVFSRSAHKIASKESSNAHQ